MFVRNRCFCALIRGLRNPEAPVRETGSYFLRPAKSNQKAHGVCRPGRDKLSAKRKVSKGFNFVSAKPPLRRAESRFAKPRASCAGVRLVTFCIVQKVTKKHARTCKKLPVASFCASETAETGRIANGREQGDHVSRRQSGKGFNFVSGKLLFEWAESRFGKPRCSRQGKRFYSFRLYEKNQKYPRGLRTSGLRGTIQISARYMIFAKMTGGHHVTGCTGKRNLSGYRR